jgi:inner membrane protein
VPSLFSHASVAIAIGSVVAPRPLLRPFLIAGAVCAMMPDLDILGPGGIEFLGGHRGFTHSFTFAALVGLASAVIVRRRPEWAGARIRLLLFIAIATATHGCLDAITSVSRGVQLFSPFSLHQYRLPLLRSGVEELIRLFMPSVLLTGVVLYLRGCRIPRFQRDAILSIREEPAPSGVFDEKLR